MFSSIRQKIIFMYCFLILIPLFIINYVSIQNSRESTFREIEVNSLKTANIISGISRDHMDDTVALKRILKQYAPSLSGRILILNKEGQVLADSLHTLEDEIIRNQEIRHALNLEEKLGYYKKDHQDILQTAVPIVTTVDTSRQVIGAVLVSTNIDEDIANIQDFRVRLISISTVAAVIGIIVAALASNEISRPIIVLSNAATRIRQGNLGETVDVKGKDEIGILAENFNQMSRELYKIDKSRSQFIGDVSHELKTPLASMKALIDSLIYGEDDIQVYKEYLGDMDTEIDRLSRLVQNLLNLSKIKETGLKKSPWNLVDLVEDSMKVLKPLLQNSDVNIKIEVQGSPLILCDPERIKEVFINLIDNALKYADETKREQSIHITGAQENRYYSLKVEDNGIGIAAKDLGSIFEKFYRADTSRSRETGGAGIGLSLVEDILKEHEWEIEVESQLGEGTTFEIRIPNKFLLNP